VLNFLGSSSLLCLNQQKLSIKGSREKIHVNLAAFQGILWVSEVFSQSRACGGRGLIHFWQKPRDKTSVLVRFHLLFPLNIEYFFIRLHLNQWDRISPAVITFDASKRRRKLGLVKFRKDFWDCY